MNSEQEQTLVAEAKTGNKEALSELWENITPKLLGYLINTLKDKTLAEDLLQTTWLKAIEALPRFQSRPNIKFSAWLFAIARNECQQHWRKSKSEDSYLEQITLSNIDSTYSEDSATQNSLDVEQVLAKLSESDQELIRLRYVADLSVNDVARVLNINFVTVRVRLHRALNKVRANINSNI